VEAERLLSTGAGLLFKGSGFYITDYRSDAYKKSAAADSGGSKSESSSGGSSSAAAD
jgi:predicted nucleic acid-binding Zn ribbon protein